MTAPGGQAVVVGASVAGLLAARVLADAYERVTIVERDRLPAAGEGRKSVPQDRHVHILLPGGRRCLDSLLPRFSEELTAAGANPFAPDDLRLEVAGHALTREVAAGDDGGASVSASRPLIEGHVRRRVLALPGVEVIEGRKAAGLVLDESGKRVTGVRVLDGDAGSEQLLNADLVVAASGRAGQVPAWLEALGYPRPEEEKLPVRLLYATRRLRRRPGVLGGDKWVLIGARPGRPRSLVLSAVEGDRWVFTLAGYGEGHRPPTDEKGFMEFAASVAPPEVMAAIREAEPLDEIVTYGFPSNLRRHYESLDRFPEGLLVTGDAITSFNPLYGQGMTIAGFEAAVLRDCLREGRSDLWRRFLQGATPYIDHAWRMAIASDLALPEVEGRRPLHVRLLNSYSDRLLKTARRDRVVATAFRSVIGMLKPPTHLMRPAVALRVLRGA